MANWWKFWENTESSSNPAPLEVAKVAEDLDEMAKELEMYREHGTSNPGLIAQARIMAEKLRTNAGEITNYQVAAAYGAVYTKLAQTRRQVIREVDKIRPFYLVDAIVSQFVDDSLSPEVGTGNIIEVSSDREDLQREIDLLEERIDLDALVSSVAPELVLYGEYTLSTVINPKKVESLGEEVINVTGNPAMQPVPPLKDDGFGLREVKDDVEQGTVVSLASYSGTEGYIAVDDKGNLYKKEPADFIKFTLSSQKIRIDLHKELKAARAYGVTQDFKDIPRYARVGKSIIYPILSKLKELELLESLVPATKLAKLASGTVVGIQVPSGYDIGKAMDAAKQAEGVLNKKVGVDKTSGELTIENIMATAGRIKVVPVFGDKGQLSKMDYQSSEPDELLSSVKDIRETILNSAGIPYELIFSSDGAGKGEILKKYARYLRKLKVIQKAFEEGVREIIYIHLTNKGLKFTHEEIKVEFYNKLIEIDNLDKLEFVDATVGLLKNVKEFVLELASPEKNPAFHDQVDISDFVTFLNEQLNVIGFNNLMKQPDPKFTPGYNQKKNVNTIKRGKYTSDGEPANVDIPNMGTDLVRKY